MADVLAQRGIEASVRTIQRAVGAFPDRASALRLAAVALQVTAIWTDRPHLGMNLLESKQQIGCLTRCAAEALCFNNSISKPERLPTS